MQSGSDLEPLHKVFGILWHRPECNFVCSEPCAPDLVLLGTHNLDHVIIGTHTFSKVQNCIGRCSSPIQITSAGTGTLLHMCSFGGRKCREAGYKLDAPFNHSYSREANHHCSVVPHANNLSNAIHPHCMMKDPVCHVQASMQTSSHDSLPDCSTSLHPVWRINRGHIVHPAGRKENDSQAEAEQGRKASWEWWRVLLCDAVMPWSKTLGERV